MCKKLVISALILLCICLSFDSKVEAGLFGKKKKSEKTQSETEAGKKEEKKVLLIEVYASWCPGCKNIQPALDQLSKEIKDIEIVQLDVSTPSKAKSSHKQAKELNIIEFFELNKSKTATVAVVVPTSKEIVTVFHNNNKTGEYKTAIEEAKSKEKALTTPPL